MARKYLETHITPAVKLAQARYYGTSAMVPPGAEHDPLGQDEIEFIAARDSFYMATISETNWPYLQHRGGPKGFLRVIGPQQLAFLDLHGNRQLLSTGNLTAMNRVSLFLMDYPHRERLKIMGHAQVLDAREHLDLAEQLRLQAQKEKAERIFMIDVVSYDWNCPKYIMPRFTAEEVEEEVQPLKARILELEKRLSEYTNPNNP
jgi:predicted pyridoxine 5'-phosphate oxidase superfamily flavin-nucleotide-binding protein